MCSCECFWCIISTVIAFAALFLSICGYNDASDRFKISALSKYNERYATDPSIRKVIEWYIENEKSYIKMITDNGGINNIIAMRKSDQNLYDIASPKIALWKRESHNMNIPYPSIYQFELFGRFLEEIGLAVKCNYITAAQAGNFFSYYAPFIMFDLEDYKNSCWDNLAEFINTEKDIICKFFENNK